MNRLAELGAWMQRVTGLEALARWLLANVPGLEPRIERIVAWLNRRLG